ncbi:helix-turn-helix transcriptional regulator [Amycolatopsis sp. K13G38]|uniref:Helix-turn-helix transcriptional regulator n=1 Tax=Amycolatopsis acididurans TaxID=2724524 RepID=A0ABX1J7I8_9PSEU|nr:TetR/AcrR family transcriptional regulator [Amycolatopsis acididurans]NKQ55703.1 helix-turn-helix transcriptional regulator [Amycolatopsis acididurans]
MAGRRSDTRERIQQIALDLFVEQGYEKTSLREIAERLEVTKAALYYHFRTKEDIVRSLFEDIAEAVDEVLDWAREQGEGLSRTELVNRLAQLVRGRFVPIWRFVQENQTALKELHVSNPLMSRMQAIFQLLCPKGADPETQLRSRLALVALVMGNNPEVLADTPEEDRPEVALRVALQLVSPRGREVETAT